MVSLRLKATAVKRRRCGNSACTLPRSSTLALWRAQDKTSGDTLNKLKETVLAAATQLPSDETSSHLSAHPFLVDRMAKVPVRWLYGA